jgi:hypothetical protein
MELVTVFKSFNIVDADLVKSRLEAAEFHVSMRNVDAALGMGGYALGAGGILVQVPSDEADEAKELLASDTDELPPTTT